jgi:hypothetical protein
MSLIIKTLEEKQAEALEQEQAQFRTERDALLKEADIEINKLDDLGKDSSSWRIYRQALRDATITWKLPTNQKELANGNGRFTLRKESGGTLGLVFHDGVSDTEAEEDYKRKCLEVNSQMKLVPY